MSRMTDKIHKMGLKLPKPFTYPSPNRTGCVVTGNLVYTSGHPPPSGFGVAVHGKVGRDIAEREAVSSAQAAALGILASVEQQVGSLEAIKQVVKVTGLVNSAPDSCGNLLLLMVPPIFLLIYLDLMQDSMRDPPLGSSSCPDSFVWR